MLLQKPTANQVDHRVEERCDESLEQWGASQRLADCLVLKLRKLFGRPHQAQQHAATFFSGLQAFLRLRQDLENTLVQAHDTTELRQLHLVAADHAEARSRLPGLRESLSLRWCQAPAGSVWRDGNRLMPQRGEEASERLAAATCIDTPGMTTPSLRSLHTARNDVYRQIAI